jgi:pSer/pThr/pTyr-binding forkhead associated (FHA) protein
MAGITLRILDGADRGRVFDGILTPVTIGREEGNTIQLNDERVSRFHLKIQDDNERLVLTDLESTNGTKVNGEDIQLRILRIGDMISLGRSTLLLGSRSEIADRLGKLQPGLAKHLASDSASGSDALLDVGMQLKADVNLQAALHEIDPPIIPQGLKPGQAAELAELIEFLHIRIRRLISSAEVDKASGQVALDATKWQYLIDLQSRLAEYLHAIGRQEN